MAGKWSLKLLDAVYGAGLVLGAPYLGARMLVDHRYRDAVGERFGSGGEPLEGEFPVWFHGASAGEVLAVRSLLRMMKEEIPGLDAVFSAVTYTGRTVAVKTYPEHGARYLPIDMGYFVRKALSRVRPKLVVLVEGDIWPNFICAAKESGAKVAVVNGRFSAKTVGRYKSLNAFFGPAFDAIDLFCLRDQAQVDNVAPLHLPEEKVVVTGNVKYDNLKTEFDQEGKARLRTTLGMDSADRVLVGGSTHAGEEEPLLDLLVERGNFRLIIVPRYPHRTGEVEGLVKERKLSSIRYSRVLSGDRSPSSDDVILVDTVGDLAGMYRAADAAFVGGSLIPRGGQNMMEPAAMGVAVLYGPHTWVFVDDVALLSEAGASIEVRDEAHLRTELIGLLDDAERCSDLGRRAREAILEKSGASRITFDRIRDLV